MPATSVLDLSLDIVATDIQTLADAIDLDITTEPAVEVSSIDWDDFQRNLVSIAWRWNSDEAERKVTNLRDMRGYTIYVVFAVPKRSFRDERRFRISELKEDIRQFYNRRRRMAGVVKAGVNELSCRCFDGGLPIPGGIRQDRDIQVLSIHCWYLEPRT